MEEEKIPDLRKQFGFYKNDKSSNKSSKIAVSHRENSNNFFAINSSEKDEDKAIERTPISPYNNDFLFSNNINAHADQLKFNSMRESRVGDSKRIEDSQSHSALRQELFNTNAIIKVGSQIRILAQVESHHNLNPESLSIDILKQNRRLLSHSNTNRCYSNHLLVAQIENNKEQEEQSQEESKVNDQLPTDQNQEANVNINPVPEENFEDEVRREFNPLEFAFEESIIEEIKFNRIKTYLNLFIIYVLLFSIEALIITLRVQNYKEDTVEYCLFFPLLVYTARMVFYCYRLSKTPVVLEQQHWGREIFYWIMFLWFFILLIFWSIFKNPYNATISTIPLGLSTIIYLWNAKWPESSCLGLVHVVRVSGCISRTSFVITLLLKISGTLDWKWVTAIWVYWWWLSLMIIVSAWAIWLACYWIAMFICCYYKWHTIISALWTVYITLGLCVTSFIVAFDVIIRNDFVQSNTKSQSQPKTDVSLPWDKTFPMIILSWYLFSIFLMSIIFYKFLVMWFDKLLYNDDINRVFAVNNPGEGDNFSASEVEITTYKFKTPGLIKRITSTYFKKSSQEDIDTIKQKIKKLKRRYMSRASSRSIDLENIMRARDYEHRRNGANIELRQEESKIVDNSFVTNTGIMAQNMHTYEENSDIGMHNTRKDRLKFEKAIHYSMASPKQIQKWNYRFRKDNHLRINQNSEMSLSKSESKADNSNKGEASDCVICYSSAANGVFFDCGHAGLWYGCAVEILKKYGKWHFCRDDVGIVLQIDINTIFDNYVMVRAATYTKYAPWVDDGEDPISESQVVNHNSPNENDQSRQEEEKHISWEETKQVSKIDESKQNSVTPPSFRNPYDCNYARDSERESKREDFINKYSSRSKSNNKSSRVLGSQRVYEEIKDEMLSDYGLERIPNDINLQYHVRSASKS